MPSLPSLLEMSGFFVGGVLEELEELGAEEWKQELEFEADWVSEAEVVGFLDEDDCLELSYFLESEVDILESLASSSLVIQ